jgi:hypothetical protein
MVIGRYRHGWDDNIRMYFQKGWEGVEWIQKSQDRGEWSEFVDNEKNIVWI